MRHRPLFWAILLAASFLATSGEARTVSVPCGVSPIGGTGVSPETGSLDEGGTLVTLEANEGIVFAEFAVEAEYPAGTEIELWPQVEGETAPWDLPAEELPFDRNFWVTDDRTGTLLRYDVTAIARAWHAGTLPNLGFVLRVIEDSAPEAPGGVGAESQSSALPVSGTLTYHIQAVREPRAKADPASRERPADRGTPSISSGRDQE